MSKTVVVTGSSGYIGGTISYLLKQKGYKVVAIDVRPQPHLHKYFDVQILDDFCSMNSFYTIKNNKPDAIIHCAGTSLVGPSLHDPGPYFYNNVFKTQGLLDFLATDKIDTKFIFSSSAAVYGDYTNNFEEGYETLPISPYGESKLMIEKTLKWYKQIFNIDYVAFRYFNACGAVPGGIHGQEPNATHIFAKLFDAALNDEAFTLNGIYTQTKDGSCVRDYVHVLDIAEAHILAIEKNLSGIYNISTGTGHSNLEIQKIVEKLLDKEIVTIIGNKREGDPATLTASSLLLKEGIWEPKYNMTDVVNHLNEWYTSDTFKSIKRS